jgi:hypothetical protein
MIANGKAPAVDYGIRPRDDGRFEIVWKTVPTTGEVETEISGAANSHERQGGRICCKVNLDTGLYLRRLVRQSK